MIQAHALAVVPVVHRRDQRCFDVADYALREAICSIRGACEAHRVDHGRGRHVVGAVSARFWLWLRRVAVAIRLQDMNVVCAPDGQRTSQPLGSEHLGPLIERSIGRSSRARAAFLLAKVGGTRSDITLGPELC